MAVYSNKGGPPVSRLYTLRRRITLYNSAVRRLTRQSYGKNNRRPPACNVEEVRGDEFQRVSHSLRILFHGFRLHSDVARLTLGSVAHTVLHLHDEGYMARLTTRVA